MDHLADIARTRQGADLTPGDLTRAAGLLMRGLDPINGGIGTAPKFPNAPIFRFLWSEYFRRNDPAARAAVRHLLNALCEGGIYDHLGGGFARYSTDAEWHVPHFEKMLYDNAQILELLALAHAETATPLFEARARETFGWLTREMLVEGAAFAASQDADQDGEEGLFFVWTADEIDHALGPDSPAFKAAYDVRPEGNWEGRNVLRRRDVHGDDAAEAALAASRARLFALREARAKPGRDDKILADWNGLLIAALARAAAVFDGAGTSRSGPRGLAPLSTRICTRARGQLVHARREGIYRRRRHARRLCEHGARRSCAVRGDGPARLSRRRPRADAQRAGPVRRCLTAVFSHRARDVADVPGVRPRHPHDGFDAPSGIGLMAEVLVRLFHLTGDAQWRERGQGLMRAFTGAPELLVQSPLLLFAADFMERGIVAVVAGAAEDPSVSALAHAALCSPDPATCVCVDAPRLLRLVRSGRRRHKFTDYAALQVVVPGPGLPAARRWPCGRC